MIGFVNGVIDRVRRRETKPGMSRGELNAIHRAGGPHPSEVRDAVNAARAAGLRRAEDIIAKAAPAQSLAARVKALDQQGKMLNLGPRTNWERAYIEEQRIITNGLLNPGAPGTIGARIREARGEGNAEESS